MPAPAVTPQELKDLGFITEGFGSPADFDTYLLAIITEQEALLSDRIGVATVANATLATQVKTAEKNLCAAELCQRRINRISHNIDVDSVAMISSLRKQRQDYLDVAEPVILKLATSPGTTDSGGYAGGVLVTAGMDNTSQRWPETV